MFFNNSSCSDLPSMWIYVGAGITAAACSLLSLVSVLLMIVLIFLFKKHHFFTQRMILYLAFSTLFKSMIGIMDVFGYWAYNYPVLDGFCISLGFLLQVTEWWTVLAAFCIMVDLFLKVVFRCTATKVEWLYIAIIFLLPIALTGWIPFVLSAYGPTGPICWIRTEDKNCTQFFPGIALQLGIHSIPLVLLMLFILALLTVTLLSLYRQRRQWAGSFDPNVMETKKMMLNEVKSVVCYPFIILLVNLPMTLYIIYSSITSANDTATIVMWYTNAAILHLDGALITCNSALDPETRKKLTCANIRAACASCFQQQQRTSDYPSVLYGSMGDSLTHTRNHRP